MTEAIILLAIGFCTQLYLLHYKNNLLLKVVSCITLLSAIYFYSAQWQWFNIWPKDAVYAQARGDKPLKSYLQWHEIFHYYLGGKYFPELGYNGLYEAALLADKESANPSYSQPELRSLRNPTEPISIVEGLRRGREEFRPKFTDARWQDFARDVEQMKSLGDRGWIDTALFDAGYNPPPSWAVFGYTVANLIPIDQATAWKDGRPNWYQIELLPMFDVLLLFVAVVLIYRAFGFAACAAFVLLFCTSFVASKFWISGAFFRYTWLFGLIGGMCMLKEKRFLLAGMLMGLSCMDRIFPLVFAAGAALPLLHSREWRPLLRYMIGGAIAAGVLFVASVAIFGLDVWVAFFEKINIHKDLFFVHHIGYRRVAVFDALTANQNFWWADGLRRMAAWNAHLTENWEHTKWLHMPFILAIISGAVFSARSIKPEESALLFGGAALFFFAIPANYYYIYFPMVAVVLISADKSIIRDVLFAALFVLWGFLQSVTRLNPDDIVQNYYICIGFMLFFLVWVLVRAYEEIRRITA